MTLYSKGLDVIPKSMQQAIKSKLHKGYLGIVLTALRARKA